MSLFVTFHPFFVNAGNEQPQCLQQPTNYPQSVQKGSPHVTFSTPKTPNAVVCWRCNQVISQGKSTNGATCSCNRFNSQAAPLSVPADFHFDLGDVSFLALPK